MLDFIIGRIEVEDIIESRRREMDDANSFGEADGWVTTARIPTRFQGFGKMMPNLRWYWVNTKNQDERYDHYDDADDLIFFSNFFDESCSEYIQILRLKGKL